MPTLSPSVISINRATVPVLFDRLLDKATKQEVLKRYEAENGTGLKEFQVVVGEMLGAD